MLLAEPLTKLQEAELVFKIIASIATTIAIFIGAAWAYFRFIRQRENYPFIDFTADIKFHKKISDWWIVELIAYIENKGKVQHQLDYFKFDLFSLNGSDEVTTNDEIGGQVYFPNKLAESSFLPQKTKYFFIEPGSKNKYSYITRVPVEAEIVILHSWFNYLDGKHSHTAEVTSKVPKDEENEKVSAEV
jgi:hypothetical protein